MAVLSAVVGVCAVGLIPWWSVAIPGGLLLIFVVVARISVHRMRRSLDARYREIRQGSDETTVFLSRKDDGSAGRGGDADQGVDVRGRQARGAVGSGADHHADLRVQAARPAYRPHHRPLRARRHLVGPAAASRSPPTRRRRADAVRRAATRTRAQAASG